MKLLMNRVIHECIKEEPNTWEKKWTKLSKILSLNLIKRLGYQKRRYVKKLNSDLIGFCQIEKHFEYIYFEYLTDEKCQLEEVRETCTKRTWWSRRHGETAHVG